MPLQRWRLLAGRFITTRRYSPAPPGSVCHIVELLAAPGRSKTFWKTGASGRSRRMQAACCVGTYQTRRHPDASARTSASSGRRDAYARNGSAQNFARRGKSFSDRWSSSQGPARKAWRAAAGLVRGLGSCSTGVSGGAQPSLLRRPQELEDTGLAYRGPRVSRWRSAIDDSAGALPWHTGPPPIWPSISARVPLQDAGRR